ncbi:response regulator, partial [Acinetobacter baumannii]
LRAGGYGVTEASGGKEAYEVAREGNFDMLVTDQVMPVMDGLSLIRALRAMPDYATVPMLMLSTEYDDAILERAREAGASGFLA